ncbi:MAG: 30S ribosomal protein S6 [Chloroflexota bacterium]|nr:30S ribosomal protein S6 [Chloroflexota bacterium]
MRNYEMVFIIHPELDEEEAEGIVDNVKDLVTRNDGKVETVKPWGLRKLAYPIDKQQEGRYVLMHFQLEPQNIAEIERVLKLTEPVIRHLIVRLET